MKNQKLTYIDLFSGCGGLSEGFNMSGKFEGLAHVEWEVPMVETLRNRLNRKWKHSKEDSLKRVIHFDIQKTEELVNGNWSQKSINDFGSTNHNSVIKSGLKGIVGKNKVDLIIGGPPCQAYSIAGRAQDKNSMKNDYRNYLFESFVKVVDSFKPEVFVFENVPGILSASRPEFMRRMKDMASMGGGGMTAFYAQMPDEVHLTINGNHSIFQALLNEPDVEKQQKQARNLADLALLSQGLLKGAELTNFINRSVDLLK